MMKNVLRKITYFVSTCSVCRDQLDFGCQKQGLHRDVPGVPLDDAALPLPPIKIYKNKKRGEVVV